MPRLQYTNSFWNTVTEPLVFRRTDSKDRNQTQDVTTEVGRDRGQVTRSDSFNSDKGLDKDNSTYQVTIKQGTLSDALRNKDIVVRENG